MPPPSTHVFTFGLNATHATEALENLILEHLEQAARKVRLNVGDLFSAPCPAEPQDVAALVTEMGDYLARTALIWSALIQSLIQGPHIDQVTLQILEKSRVDTGVADITASVSMDVTLSRLRKMRDLAEQYSRDVQAVWRVGGRRSSLASYAPRMSFSSHDGPPSVTSSATSLDMLDAPDTLSRAAKRRKQLPDASAVPPSDETAIGANPGEQDESDDYSDENEFAGINMKALKQRGKGKYYCPRGHQCDKGGVDKHGNLILFDRNSSFAYVIVISPPFSAWRMAI
ncbi:uncharacterized protein TRIVIDRAFT_147872 [Trichoderma virens Gv29-8]|uniref:Uncharacterized protein n=1 Tax=Hypocrea virens (strain Gv29-8 / FGSC 10586) TaxID=413071 RepID=G9MPE5_HYPVG|nr:uncharacterized protein TRIVIDRAFT_147872 [Trichoderma virens Gv29-8]EHK23746.1 hypothetical protein TRIVIDRAFT_147872 [Trichoderma virens Gv29-8]UKZ50044.1 hypothetical protein TrVGV298_004299 [Trichoderma virens]